MQTADASGGTFNCCAPNPVTNREFSSALGRALDRPAIAPAPKLAATLLLGREMADASTASIRAVPRRALDAGHGFRFEDVEAALRDLLA